MTYGTGILCVGICHIAVPTDINMTCTWLQLYHSLQKQKTGTMDYITYGTLPQWDTMKLFKNWGSFSYIVIQRSPGYTVNWKKQRTEHCIIDRGENININIYLDFLVSAWRNTRKTQKNLLKVIRYRGWEWENLVIRTGLRGRLLNVYLFLFSWFLIYSNIFPIQNMKN